MRVTCDCQGIQTAVWQHNHFPNADADPAYDIAPQIRAQYEANQPMLISDTDRRSRLATCLAAAEKFHLQPGEARAIVDGAIDTIIRHWQEVCDEAQLSQVKRKVFAGRQFLNP